jgi:aminoglycoside phosphotransferase (APT) family kinase protein
MVLKSGTRIRMTEAHTLRLVKKHTTIPVPEVLDAWPLDGGGAAILMEWINDADTLRNRWPSLTAEQKLNIAQQIRGYVDQLRALPQAEDRRGRIESVDGSACYDARLQDKPCGPFPSEHDFNDFLVSRVACFMWEPGTRAQIERVRDKLREDHQIVLTHGDINDRNILVNNDGNIVAILDWEMAGWMPEYWEYVKCVHGRWENADCLAYTKIMAPPYEEEMENDDQFIIINGGAPL